MGQETRGNSTYPLKWKEIGPDKSERESWGSNQIDSTWWSQKTVDVLFVRKVFKVLFGMVVTFGVTCDRRGGDWGEFLSSLYLDK